MKRIKIGELLLEENLVSQEQLDIALAKQKSLGLRLGETLIKLGFINESDLLRTLAKKLSYQYTENPISLMDETISVLLSSEFVKEKKIVPLYVENGILYIATSDPLDFVTLEDVSIITDYNTVPVVVPSSRIEQAYLRMYSGYSDAEDVFDGTELSSEDIELMDRVDSAPIVKLVNTLITNAYLENASDIHIEPEEFETKIRYRVDGILKEHMVLKKEIHDLVITRIKIISGMNIAEKRVPQDGSFRLINDTIKVDLRISSIPTSFGEKVVVRLLGTDKNINYDLDDLAISDTIRNQIKKLIRMPNGIVLVTGPTGSGKTTTLYSVLSELSTVDKSVVTVEDPVEKHFDGITQVQINTKAGLTFSSGLRSILRQDPDIIMVGEIRDSETADIAIRAAITGHLVLSTLHTNDAISSVVRLVDMGVEPYLVASSVKAVIAQRLVRKVCPFCKEDVEVSYEDKLLLKDETLTKQKRGSGCERCDHTGYRGRTPVFELIVIDTVLQNMIASNRSTNEMLDYVKSKGTTLLRDDLLKLVKEGETTTEEVRKILFSVD